MWLVTVWNILKNMLLVPEAPRSTKRPLALCPVDLVSCNALDVASWLARRQPPPQSVLIAGTIDPSLLEQVPPTDPSPPIRFGDTLPSMLPVYEEREECGVAA